jgi:hypothetical protein
MDYRIRVGVPLILVSVAGCGSAHSHAATPENTREIASPAPSRSFSPRVSAMRDGGLLLSWLEPTNDKLAALRFSLWRDGAWTRTATIVEGQPFSRHPSESPGVIALSANNLIAYWSQKPPHEETPSEEVDVYFSVSTDQGVHWTVPTLANLPGTGQESSYPSAAPVDATHAELIWLDGTSWKKQQRMTLMSRTVRSNGSAAEAAVIDPDTCTCCPTSLVQTSSGLLAAYRGHTPDNIRDISLLQNVQGRWSQPRIAHADNWHIAGCPVNGPQLDAAGLTTALIWFSAPQDQPEVKLAFSDDGGLKFTPPVRVDDGNVMGRAQIVLLPQHSALAFWLENRSGTTRLLGRSVRDEAILGTPFEVANGQRLGYPHAVRAGNEVFVTWAEEKPTSQVHVAVVGHESE